MSAFKLQIWPHPRWKGLQVTEAPMLLGDNGLYLLMTRVESHGSDQLGQREQNC